MGGGPLAPRCRGEIQAESAPAMGTERADKLRQAAGEDVEGGPRLADVLNDQTWATVDAQSSRKQLALAQAARFREMNSSGDWNLASDGRRAGFAPSSRSSRASTLAQRSSGVALQPMNA